MCGAMIAIVYCVSAAGDRPCRCSLAAAVDALIAASRRPGSSQSVASFAQMNVIAVPVSSSSAGRTFTGRPAVSDAGGSAPTPSRNRRSAVLHTASTTSLTVQSVAFATALTSSRSRSCVAKRR